MRAWIGPSRLLIGAAVLLLVASVVLIWVPWLPLDAKAECGWTCYVPIVPGERSPEVLSLVSRGGRSVAPFATVVSIVAAVFALATTAARPRLPRLAPGALVVLGVVSLVASGTAIARILRQDVILVSSGSHSVAKVGDPAIGPGSVLAIVVGAAVLLMGLFMLWPTTRRPPASVVPRVRPADERMG